MTRHSSSTSSSSLNFPSDSSSSYASPASSPTPLILPDNLPHFYWELKQFPLSTNPSSDNVPPLPPPPSSLVHLPKTSTESVMKRQRIYGLRTFSMVDGEDRKDPFMLALRACTQREKLWDEEGEDTVIVERASYGGNIQSVIRGLFKQAKSKVQQAAVDALSMPAEISSTAVRCRRPKAMRKQIDIGDLLGCKSIHSVSDTVIKPSLIYRKGRYMKSQH